MSAADGAAGAFVDGGPRFFVDVPLAAGRIALPAAVAHHACNVLRLRPQAPIRLFDGSGGEWQARLGDGAQADLDRFDPVERESPIHLTLVQALVATDKLDWIVEKATELGVAAVHVVAARRSTVRLADDRRARRLAHWRQIIQSACAQCGRNRVPTLDFHVDLQRTLAAPALQASAAPSDGATVHALRALLAPDGERPLHQLLASSTRAPTHVLIAVGPEGGWSDDERSAARAAGWLSSTLGPRVLRTETAGLAALAATGARCGDL